MYKQNEIIIIEDDYQHFKLIKYAFNKKNDIFKIINLKDGKEAIEYLQSNDISSVKFILLDINIPKISGLDLLLKIKSNKSYINVPIIIFTTSQSESDIKEAYKNGANSYIIKPIDFKEFIHIIDAIYRYWYTQNATS